MHMRLFLLPLLAPLALAYSEVYHLNGFGQVASSSECFSVRPYSSWSLLDYRDPSATLNLTAHKPIIRKKDNDGGVSSVAVLFYEESAIENVTVCDHSAVKSESCDESDLGKFIYNSSSGFVEEFVWTDLYSNATIPLPQGGKFCVKAVDSDAISYSIKLRVHTSNGLNEMEVEKLVESSVDTLLFIALAMVALLVWRKTASYTPFLIKAIIVYYITKAVLSSESIYYHVGFARFEEETEANKVLKYSMSLAEEITAYSQRLFFFLYSGGVFYSSYDLPAFSSIRVPTVVISLMCIASFFCKEFIENNMPHFIAHLVLVAMLGVYTLVRFYRFRNTIEDKDSLDYKRLVWTTLWFYTSGTIFNIVKLLFSFFSGMYSAATGAAKHNFYFEVFTNAGLLTLESLISLVVILKLWIPSLRYHKVDLAKAVE